MIITLCGSTRFEAAFHYWNERLTMDGHVVLALAVYPSQKGDKNWYTPEQKVRLDEVHKRKIDISHAVFVVDNVVPGQPTEGPYIGDSTLSEITHAAWKSIPAFYASSCLIVEKRDGWFPVPKAW